MQKISVIVPIYNRQAYLRKGLETLVKQTYENIEIILINDASTDQSLAIMKEYQAKYPEKVVVYDKPNTGIADTRNFGVQKVTGDYFCFVDSDDWIEENLLMNLSKYIEKQIDLIKYKLIRQDETGHIIEKVDGPIFQKVTGEEAFNQLCFTDVLLDSPCIYLFRTAYWKENKFEFEKHTYHEDFGLIPLVVLKANTVVSTPYYGYYYIQSKKSITRGNDYEKTRQRMQDVLVHYDHMIEAIKEYPVSEESKRNLRIYYTNAILLKLNELKKEDQKEFIKQIKKRKMIKNFKANNIKQFIKKMILCFNIRCYLKMK